MIKYSDITKSVGDQTVETTKLVEERLVEGLQSFEPVTQQFASMLPEMPETPKLPLVEAMPSFVDFVEANAALVERVVKANKELFVAVAKAIPSPKPATTKA